MSIPKTPMKIKHTGDTHLPDVESDLDVEEATSTLAMLAQPRDQGGRPRVRHAGMLVAPEGEPDLDATADGRDAGTPRSTLSRGSKRPLSLRDQEPQRTSAANAQRPAVTRSATGVWIGALAVAVLLVRLLR